MFQNESLNYAAKYLVIQGVLTTIYPALLFAVYKIYKSDKKRFAKGVGLIISLVVLSCIIPLRPTENQAKSLYSIYDYISAGNLAYLGMMICYIVATILTFSLTNKTILKLATWIYVLGSLLVWVGGFQTIGASGYLVYPPAKGQFLYILSFLWLALYILFPAFVLLLFVPLTNNKFAIFKEIERMTGSKSG